MLKKSLFLCNIFIIIFCMGFVLSGFAYYEVSRQNEAQTNKQKVKIIAQMEQISKNQNNIEFGSEQYKLFEQKQKKLDEFILSITKRKENQFYYSDKSYPDSFGGSFLYNKEPFICIVQDTLPSDKVVKFAKENDIKVLYVKYSLNQLNATADKLVNLVEKPPNLLDIQDITIDEYYNCVSINVYELTDAKMENIKKLIAQDDMLDFFNAFKRSEDAFPVKNHYFTKNTRVNFNWKKAQGAIKYDYKIINQNTNKSEKHVITKAQNGFFNTPNTNRPAVYLLIITALDSKNNIIRTYEEFLHVEENIEEQNNFIGLHKNKVAYF